MTDNYEILTDDGVGSMDERLASLHDKTARLLAAEGASGRHLAYTKVLLSDIANQEEALERSSLMRDIVGTAAHTVIQQSPIGGPKVALLIKTSREPSPYQLVSMRLTDDEALNHGSYVQTLLLFDKYVELLGRQGLNLRDHCVRTWIYVRDIDSNYAGAVKARNDMFRQHGLTPDTHFIASTGIGGRASGRGVVVAIDFLTWPGARQQSISYLHAPDHLNPTHEYGVAFERGTSIRLPGRQQLFISGTASINSRGEVVHPGDVASQTRRLIENIGALLADGGATLHDIRYFVVYLRDLADYGVVEAYMDSHFPDVPRVITSASVCRPQWLVEMECVAIRPAADSDNDTRGKA
ncbi:MAG: translation initiation inhibitor [Prevotella sp.]|nr:translation initiation inhibitor [Prevotella sp.]